jgi:mannose-1-phosphate guanylyltransferase/mannose-1-phosphate guanylyltransferase/mannose-6-phosphate isomerase
MFADPIVVTGPKHVEHVESQLWPAPGALVIVEPEPKNTAAAIALAANNLPADAIMLVCPSDHHIGDRNAFIEAANRAAELAQKGNLVAFGIKPSRAETGFGYIKRGEPMGPASYSVVEFTEKPDIERAKQFCASGEFWWNGGIFAFRAGTFLKELQSHRPEIAKLTEQAVSNGRQDGRRFHPDPSPFAAIESESVDYAVMENTRCAAMVTAELDWSDIGNWQALHEARERNSDGNTVFGNAELIGCTNTLVESDGPRVHAIGLDGIVIVVDGNDILVTAASEAQSVGKLSGAINQ